MGKNTRKYNNPDECMMAIDSNELIRTLVGFVFRPPGCHATLLTGQPVGEPVQSPTARPCNRWYRFTCYQQQLFIYYLFIYSSIIYSCKKLSRVIHQIQINGIDIMCEEMFMQLQSIKIIAQVLNSITKLKVAQKAVCSARSQQSFLCLTYYQKFRTNYI